MASITSIGVGSGIDLEGLVDSIIASERDPVTQSLDLKEASVQANISAFGSLKSTLSAFQSSLSSLKNSSFFNSQNATSGDSSLYTATTDGSAVLANYDIAVLYEAKAHRLVSPDFATASTVVGSGTLTIDSGSTNFDVTISSGTNDSLSDIRDSINDAAGNDGAVNASILTVDDGMGGTVSKLVLSTSNTGEDNEISIVVDDDDLADKDGAGLSQLFYNTTDPSNQMIETAAAQDAEITIDGFTAKSSTNEIKDAIAGVTINVVKGSDDPMDPDKATLVINKDTAGLKGTVETFVASFNELTVVFNALTDYDAATETRGLLMGDSSVSTIESQIRRIVGETVTGASSTLNSLTSLGITTNNQGLLSLDEDTLNSAVTTETDNFSDLFAGDNGIASRLDSILDNFLGSGGILSTREDGFQTRLRAIEDARFDLDFRLEKVESRFRSQFSSLDILVSQLNSTGDFLLQQLDAAAQIITSQK